MKNTRTERSRENMERDEVQKLLAGSRGDPEREQVTNEDVDVNTKRQRVWWLFAVLSFQGLP